MDETNWAIRLDKILNLSKVDSGLVRWVFEGGSRTVHVLEELHTNLKIYISSDIFSLDIYDPDTIFAINLGSGKIN